ncbi:hypothetical protein B0H14DRAFT_2557687 [Mycena olivaceomarginata]|nr:hypothetical protein B0H14DRAFT_2557687 [Mycena olivaceomarginata]
MTKNKEYEEPSFTVWDRWQPACDACGCLESSLEKPRLLSCSGCLVAKYCSVRPLPTFGAQIWRYFPERVSKQDWEHVHKAQCHLFEADRKLSTVFVKSLGPGTINDPALSLADKVIQWNFLNVHNHMLIACAALNDKELAATMNVGIFLKLVGDRTGSKYDNRTFIIERVAYLPRESSNKMADRTVWKYGNSSYKDAGQHSKVLVGFCMLPNDKMADTQMWRIPLGPDHSQLRNSTLPPNFDLHRYITHINRGVTHFHASFWALPRDISDSDLESADPLPEYDSYLFDHHLAISGLMGQGIMDEHGNRTPIIKIGLAVHVRLCAPGEADTEGAAAYRKLLVDPSRIVKMLAKDLSVMYEAQDMALGMTEIKRPI